MADTLEDLAFTSARAGSKNNQSRASLIASQGLDATSKAGFMAPLVGFLVARSFEKGQTLDRQEAEQFSSGMMELLSDRTTAPEDKLIDAIGLAQQSGRSMDEAIELVKDFFSAAKSGAPEESEPNPIQLGTKDKVDAFIENLPDGAKVKLDVDAAAVGLDDLAGTLVRIDYTKKPVFEDEMEADLRGLGARGVGTDRSETRGKTGSRAQQARKSQQPAETKISEDVQAQVEQLKRQAEEAIAQGKDPNLVNQRLEQLISELQPR